MTLEVCESCYTTEDSKPLKLKQLQKQSLKKIRLVLDCMIPENIHTPPTEGHWKFLGEGGY